MIDITECTSKCFANVMGMCDLLASFANIECGNTCPFYKPQGCKDWVKVERDGRTVLFDPEEYQKEFENEQIIQEQRNLYWTIKRVPNG